MATPAGPEYGVKYTLTGPDGTIAVFNDSTSPNFVGALSPESSGLDSAEVREAAVDAVEADGGIHGNFYYGRRPVVLQGIIIATSAEDRNKKAAKIQGASNAMRGDATLKWTPVGGEELELQLRRQQPVRITKGFVKEFQIPLVSADARVYSAATTTSKATDVLSGPMAKLPTEAIDGSEGGVEKWENKTNIFTKNNVYAKRFLSENTSQGIRAQNFKFAIPSAAKILGIEVLVERKTTSGGGVTVKDAIVRLAKSGLPVGSNLAKPATWPIAEEVVSYGGPTNLWGTTWAPPEFNSEVFGVEFAAKAAAEPSSAEIDSIEVIVYYETAPIAVFTTNNGNANSQPTLKITGPGKNFIIKNVTTGESMTLESVLASGHYIEINFRNRTILEDGTKNIYSNLSFSKSIWWELHPGGNEISVQTVEGSTTATKIELLARSAWI